MPLWRLINVLYACYTLKNGNRFQKLVVLKNFSHESPCPHGNSTFSKTRLLHSFWMAFLKKSSPGKVDGNQLSVAFCWLKSTTVSSCISMTRSLQHFLRNCAMGSTCHCKLHFFQCHRAELSLSLWGI